MKILVTGGAGFLGSHLCDVLIEQGHSVVCLDNFYSGQRDNITHLLQLPKEKFELMEHDVETPLQLTGLDQIYHLACPASPVFYQAEPIKTTKTSVIGTINMLELALRNNARILYTSTSEVYGDPLEHPQKETYWGNVNPHGLRSCYDEGKRCAEALAFDYHRQMGCDIRVARIFNTYGPRMTEGDGRVISNFVVQALQGTDITVYGDGSQTRSFCYCSDTVAGLVALMEGDYIGPVNIGRPQETTILEVAQLIHSKVQSKQSTSSKLVHKGLPSDDPVRRLPDISVAKDKLNWEPSMKLNDGLDRTIDYFFNRQGVDLSDSPLARLKRKQQTQKEQQQSSS